MAFSPRCSLSFSDSTATVRDGFTPPSQNDGELSWLIHLNGTFTGASTGDGDTRVTLTFTLYWDNEFSSDSDFYRAISSGPGGIVDVWIPFVLSYEGGYDPSTYFMHKELNTYAETFPGDSAHNIDLFGTASYHLVGIRERIERDTWRELPPHSIEFDSGVE